MATTTPERYYFSLGYSPNDFKRQIRGYKENDFAVQQQYITSSLEYRYNFGLQTAVTQTIIGIAFFDAAYIDDGTNLGINDSPIYIGAGLAAQFNVVFGIPPIRLEYGFSPKNPTGVFSFGLGFSF